MKRKFCPLTREDCREDCALYVKHTIKDGKQDKYTGCAFAVNSNATIEAANSAAGIEANVDGFIELEDVMRDVYKALRSLA